MLISLQILTKTFPSNIITDVAYNLSKFMQSEVFENCLKWLNTVGNLLKVLRILTTVLYFKDQNLISKTLYCMSCLVVGKMVFCSKFPDIPDNAGRKTRKRRTMQLQSVMHFTQMQQVNKIKGFILFPLYRYQNIFNFRPFFSSITQIDME